MTSSTSKSTKKKSKEASIAISKNSKANIASELSQKNSSQINEELSKKRSIEIEHESNKKKKKRKYNTEELNINRIISFQKSRFILYIKLLLTIFFKRQGSKRRIRIYSS